MSKHHLSRGVSTSFLFLKKRKKVGLKTHGGIGPCGQTQEGTSPSDKITNIKNVKKLKILKKANTTISRSDSPLNLLVWESGTKAWKIWAYQKEVLFCFLRKWICSVSYLSYPPLPGSSLVGKKRMDNHLKLGQELAGRNTLISLPDMDLEILSLTLFLDSCLHAENCDFWKAAWV